MFKQVPKTEVTNPLKQEEKEYKFNGPRIRLIQDEALKLVKYTRPEVIHMMIASLILSEGRKG
jgi:hypothetical protein